MVDAVVGNCESDVLVASGWLVVLEGFVLVVGSVVMAKASAISGRGSSDSRSHGGHL